MMTLPERIIMSSVSQRATGSMLTYPVKFTVAQIDALRAKPAALPQASARPAHATTKMKAVAALASELTALRARGWGLQALAAFLAEGGVTISTGTLKNYLPRAGATRKSPGRKT
jgi:hypothetical protein